MWCIETITPIAIISIIFIIIFKDLLFDSKNDDPEYYEESNSKKSSRRGENVVGYEDVAFNSDIQESISVPLSQNEIDALLQKIGNVDGKNNSKQGERSTRHKKQNKPKKFNTLKFMMLYGFNIVALAAVSHSYSEGYVTKVLDKLSTIGGTVVQLVMSLVSLGISIVYSLIDSLALSLVDRYDVFADKYLTSKIFEAGALVGLIIGLLFINSIFMNKLINSKSISAKLGILINFAIMLLTAGLLVYSILDLYGKSSIINLL